MMKSVVNTSGARRLLSPDGIGIMMVVCDDLLC
jgi:hypothetical protein